MDRREFFTSTLAFGAATLAAPSIANACQMPRFSSMPTQAVLDLTKRYQDWYFNPTWRGYLRASSVTPSNDTYWISMKGRPPIKFLQYERQSRGINLGWTDNANNQTERRSRKFFMVKRNGDTGVLRYGQRFALGWDRTKPFLYYKPRDNGINLRWTSRPVFEWTILGGGPNGTAVKQNHAAVLFNTTHNMPMHWFERSRAGHIGWPDSKRDFWTKFGSGTITGNPCPQQTAVRALQYLANS